MSNQEMDNLIKGIAVIGLVGRFPGAKSVGEFWENLCEGRESISFFSDEELEDSGVDIALLSNPDYVKASANISDIEMFDASFFGFSPREAETTDPQHRILIECAWKALENAGYEPGSGKNLTGVYVGTNMSSYLLRNLSSHPNLIESIGLPIIYGNSQDYAATRVSYKLNLKGPSLNIQTSCSTSLVAVHSACQGLLNYECDMALAGGICIQNLQKEGYLYQEGGITSPDGHCRTFDASSQGTIFGNGVGLVVLKRLEDAITDGDHIKAVIKGSAINNDGDAKVGYASPSVGGQAKIIAEAQAIAGVNPETITYIETHGTGTPLGDPIEISALTKVFADRTKQKGFCAIGSVKTNVGHLDTAAGVTGLIKTVLALKHKQIPPSLHFEKPNPEIDFANSPFYVNTQLSQWETNGTPRRAGVSSFGIGGTNAHVILEEAPIIETSSPSRPYQLLLLSAKTSTALDTARVQLGDYLEQNPNITLPDVAYTLQVGRRDFDYRRVVICQDLDDAVKSLNSQDPQRILSHHHKPGHTPVIFMFSGQGSQYANMGRELYEVEPIFKQHVDNCAEILQPHLGVDIRSLLYPKQEEIETASNQLQQTSFTQSALFVTEYALAKLFLSWGVRPEAMIGHSIGEYVAATIAGVFSLEDALKIVAKRGQLMQQLPTGSMLAIRLPEKDIQQLLDGNQLYRECLQIAVINSQSSCVVSGTNEVVVALEEQLGDQEVECRQLHTSHAFHSVMMEPILEGFNEVFKTVKLNSPSIRFISNLTGDWISESQATNPDYWCQHLRKTVRFSDGISQLIKQFEGVFLEVGPGRTLSTLTTQHLEKNAKQQVLTSLRHVKENSSDVKFLLQTLGRLWLGGVEIGWSGFYTHERRHRLPLPTYPFERQRYWIEPQASLEQVTINRELLWKSLLKAGQTQACAGVKEFDEQTHLENKQCLESLCTAYINLSLNSLRAFSNLNKKYSIEELFEQCQIIPRYRQLLCRWLNILVEQGQLQQEQKLFTNFLPFSTEDINTLLEEAKVRFANTPQEVNTVQQCGENLATVLTGKQEPLELFVALAQKETAEDLNQKIPSTDEYFKGIIQASLEQVVKLLPSDSNLRILEIGGGQGIATEVLLPILPSKQTNYTFTDVGGLFLQSAQQKFSAYPFVEYHLLDIQQPPTEQGYSTHSFDVVIAVNVLHVTRNMTQTLEHVRSLLAPGGFFLIWEITQPQIEFDMTYGLLMNPLEDEKRNQGNPFLSKEQWQEALRDRGFSEVVALSETEAFGQDILVAQASMSADLAAPPAFTMLVESKNANQMPPVSLDKKPDIADWIYIPSWKRSMPPQPFDSKVQTTRPGCWLVFVDECNLGEKMVQRLELDGHEVITVKVGEQFGKDNQLSQRVVYTINPRQQDDYEVLFKELLTLNKTPNRIVHLWSVTPNLHPELSIESLEKSEYLGFYSLLFLAQAFGENNQTDSLEIAIISNNMQEVIGSDLLSPEKALVLGPCKVMPLEYPNINCRSIDVVIPAKESLQEEQLINQLLAELTTQTSDPVIAYRGNHRWVQDCEPVRLEGKLTGNSRLRDGGVYLITGGLGGVGLALAEYLAQTVQAKLILIGRSLFPERDQWEEWLSTHEEQNVVSQKIQKLQALEALGTEVLVVSADVANFKEMSDAIVQGNNRFGQIHGVIHAAAVLGGGMIQFKTLEDAAIALAPKVRGTRILDVLFQDVQLDFFILCSSLSSFVGVPGMVDYTAENAFLDAFAHYSAVKHSRFTCSINWDRWNGLGMAIPVEARHQELTGEALTQAMTTPEGIEVFRRILCSSTVPQIIVSTQDVQRRTQTEKPDKELTQQIQSKPSHPRPNLNTVYVAPNNEIEQGVADIWQQLLGIEQVGIHDNFFELGGDSLYVSVLFSQLCKTFQVELSYKNLFNQATVAELAEVIVQKMAEQTDEGALAQALIDIEQLSEDEARKILDSQIYQN